MAEYVTLLGSEQVARAGSSMQSAAEQMSRAASEISEALQRHERFMDDWLARFEAAMRPLPEPARDDLRDLLDALVDKAARADRAEFDNNRCFKVGSARCTDPRHDWTPDQWRAAVKERWNLP